MPAEINEIREFLTSTHPFSALDDEQLQLLATDLQIRYLREGEAAAPDPRMVYVVRSGAVDCRGEDDALVDRLGPHEVYPRRAGLKMRYHAYEDSLVLSAPRAELLDMFSDNESFTSFFGADAERRSHSIEQFRSSRERDDVTGIGELRAPVTDVLTPPVTVSPAESIQSVATKLTEADRSCAVVVDNGRLVGIVSDTDFRERVLAAGVSPQQPIGEVMSREPIYIGDDSLLFEAMLQLAGAGYNHIPVLGDDGAVVGICTTADIMKHLQADPIFASSSFRNAPAEELGDCMRSVTDVAVRFIERGATSAEASRVLSIGVDELIRRSHQLIVDDLGEPPAEFCLVAMGSHGRMEMGLASDQDHALILSAEAAEHSEYFAEYGKRISELLHSAGIPLCPGDMMASNPRWRLTVEQWSEEFSRWTGQRSQEDLMHAQTFFDMRPVVGEEELCEDVRDAALAAARRDRRFVNSLISIALRREPPLGFFREFVVQKGGDYAHTLDVKKGGLTAVTQLARLYAISAWVDEVGTRDRLHAAGRAGVVSPRTAQDLVDAFDVFSTVLLNHQASLHRNGEAANTHINPKQLGRLERENLRDAFRLVRQQLKAADNGKLL